MRLPASRWALPILSLHLALHSDLTTALQVPQLQPFISALPQLLADYLPESFTANTTTTSADDDDELPPHESLLLRRQSNNGCPSSFNSCSSKGAANVCCVQGSVCSADARGNIACCPSGAVCTGVVSSTITAGTVDGSGVVVVPTGTGGTGLLSSGQATTTTGFGQGTQPTTTTTAQQGGQSSNSGFIVAGTNTVATPARAARAVEIVS